MATMATINRKSKDSVFIRLFQDKSRILQLYRGFHPEVTDITEEDIEVKTLESVIVNTQYNDLGFTIKNKFVLLVEAQSSWNPNIALRMLFYLAETLRRFLMETEQSEHGKRKVKIPKPELYVLYSGEGKKPDVISLSEDFFDGSTDIELKVRVLSKVDTTISGQYIGFCKIFDEQRKLYKDGMMVAKETYRLCIEMGYLVDFMKQHEKEVIDMMSELFDEEFMREQYDKAERKQSYEEGTENGKISVALKLIARGKDTFEEIAELTGLTFEEVQAIASSISTNA